MVSHLLLADDTLWANQERLLLRCTLLCFEAISGLKVNFAKSELVPVGEVQGVVELTHRVSCKVLLHCLVKLCLLVRLESLNLLEMCYWRGRKEGWWDGKRIIPF